MNIQIIFTMCQCSVTTVALHPSVIKYEIGISIAHQRQHKRGLSSIFSTTHSKEGKRGLDYHENVYIFGAKHGVEAKGNGANNLIKSHTEPKNRFIERINYEKTYGIECWYMMHLLDFCKPQS